MKTSIESQQIGKAPVGSELASSRPPITQRKRNFGFAFSALLATIGATGCNSASSIPETTSYQVSRQNFGMSPEGFIQNPTNPNEGYIRVGNNMVHVMRGADGWESAEEYRRPRSIMNNAPDRFAPMTEFLARNNLSREDWIQLSETYARTEVIDEQSHLEVTLLRSLNEFIQNDLNSEKLVIVLQNYYRCLAAITLSRKFHSVDGITHEDITRLEQALDNPDLAPYQPSLREPESQPVEGTSEATENPMEPEVAETDENKITLPSERSR